MNDKKIADMIIDHILEIYAGFSEGEQHVFDMGELYGKIVLSRNADGIVYIDTDSIKVSNEDSEVSKNE